MKSVSLLEHPAFCQHNPGYSTLIILTCIPSHHIPFCSAAALLRTVQRAPQTASKVPQICQAPPSRKDQRPSHCGTLLLAPHNTKYPTMCVGCETLRCGQIAKIRGCVQSLAATRVQNDEQWHQTPRTLLSTHVGATFRTMVGSSAAPTLAFQQPQDIRHGRSFTKKEEVRSSSAPLYS